MRLALIGQKGIPALVGGVERYAEDLAVRLAARGEDVFVYTRAHYTPKNMASFRGVRLISLPSLNTKHLDAISHSFLAAVHACFASYDAIHFQSIGPALVIWIPKLFSPKTKIVATLQSKDYEHQKWSGFAKWFLKLGERMMCFFADEIIVVTKSMCDYVRAEYGREAKYVPNGANLPEIAGSSSLAKWNLEKGKYIVAISRLVRHKGLQYLIAAYKQINTDMPLVIVGSSAFSDDYVSELKELAKGNENIIFTGSQTGFALAELYSNAYLFVQPSESEGLSLALLEAMARRVPVLVSNIIENLEAVGETGFIFENKNIEDLREKLRFILNEPELASEKAELAQERIITKFNWENITDEILKMYQAVPEMKVVEANV